MTFVKLLDAVCHQYPYASTIRRKYGDMSTNHRLEFFSFLPVDGFEWVVALLFFLEVASEENGFADDPVVVFLNIFQLPLSSEEIALPVILCEV